MIASVLVVPHFDEAARFDAAPLEAFVRRRPDARLLLVDDGSRDGTGRLLAELERRVPGGAVELLALPDNVGKAEAVRRGILRAAESAPRYVGYWDADLATPLDALDAFEHVLHAHPEVEMVFGARVQLLGRSIVRSAVRHYLGRVFATAASLTLGLPIYDTQCGAKLFRVTPTVRGLFADRFVGGWIFDVEILARRIAAGRAADLPAVEDVVYELPLDTWIDVAGSKVGPVDFARAILAMWRIRDAYLGRGARPASRA